LLAELEKLGHKTIPEAARTLIDKAIAKGLTVEQLRADEKHFQENVLRLKAKIEAGHDKSELTFFDRGMHDSLAYLRHYGFKLETWIQQLIREAQYRKVFLLEPLDSYQPDYARTEDESFTKKLHQLLHEAYSEFGMKPIIVPPTSIEERAKFVLDNVTNSKKAANV
jgi:predicted ATPase